VEDDKFVTVVQTSITLELWNKRKLQHIKIQCIQCLLGKRLKCKILFI